MANYYYSIDDDFINLDIPGVISPTLLTQEINSSAIASTLLEINVEGDDVEIVFSSALSVGDESILDGLIAAHTGTPSGVQPSEDDLAIVQVRRNSSLAITSSWQDVVFSITDTETISEILEHDSINTERVLIKSSINYEITYGFGVSISSLDTYEFRLFLNGSSLVNGSYAIISSSDDEYPISRTVKAGFSSGSYLTLQVRKTGAGVATIKPDIVLTINNLQGIKGDTGPQGPQGVQGTQGTQGIQGLPGTNEITLQEEGSNLSNSPHSTINFVGPNVTASDVDGTIAKVVISGISNKSESHTYTNISNKVIGPLINPPSAAAEVNVFAHEGPLQKYIQDYTVREVVGGSSPGYYICVSPTSTAPGGGSFFGGVNPGTGIDSILTSGDVVRILYAI